MKVYLAGPMSGYPAFNIPAFDAAAEVLRQKGHEVVSPAEVDGPITREQLLKSPAGDHADLPEDESWSFYLARDFRILHDEGIEAIVCLPGWEKSKGADWEVYIGAKLGIPRLDYAPDDEFGVTTPPETQGLYDEEGRFISHETNPLRQRSLDGGVKDNRGKAPIDLIPYEPLLGAAEVLAFGARKYKPGNWRLGLSWSQTWSSLQRHLWAWMNGEEIDPESGLLHIDHAMCQLLFLSTYVHLRMTRFDDRWVSTPRDEAVA